MFRKIISILLIIGLVVSLIMLIPKYKDCLILITSYKQQIEQKDNMLAKKDLEIEKLEKLVEEQQAEIETLKQQIAKYEEQIVEYEERIKRLEEQIQNLESQINKLIATCVLKENTNSQYLEIGFNANILNPIPTTASVTVYIIDKTFNSQIEIIIDEIAGGRFIDNVYYHTMPIQNIMPYSHDYAIQIKIGIYTSNICDLVKYNDTSGYVVLITRNEQVI